MLLDLVSHFSAIEDPRKGNHQLHKLSDVIIVATLAAICGADTWADMEEFGKAKEDWLKSFLELPNGIPSHDTFNRIFSIVDAKEFQLHFMSWVRDVYELTEGQVVAIDGKTVRGSRDKFKNKRPIHLVHAWANENGILLGQKKVDKKSNEITAIPELLDFLHIKGCIVTIDAMGCQKQIASKIVDKRADYVLAVKGNQGDLHDDIKTFLDDIADKNENSIKYEKYRTIEKDHGRVEKRTYWLTADIDFLNQKEDWRNLAGIGMVESKRHIGGKETVQCRYFITTLKDINSFARAVREHWGVENSLHWTLDVTFREDDQRTRIGDSAENAALLRRLALNFVKQEKATKGSMRMKRKRAGWDNRYLETLLKISSI